MRVTLPQIHIRHALFTFNALRSTHRKSVKAGKGCNPQGFQHFTNAHIPWLIPKFEIATLPSADVAHGSTVTNLACASITFSNGIFSLVAPLISHAPSGEGSEGGVANKGFIANNVAGRGRGGSTCEDALCNQHLASSWQLTMRRKGCCKWAIRYSISDSQARQSSPP